MEESKTDIGKSPHNPPFAKGGARGDFIIQVACGLIWLYQWQSPLWGRHCRFYPSCSEYMRQSLLAFGLRRGLVRGALRLLKCHPWHPGGVDQIPPYPPLSKGEIRGDFSYGK